MNSSRLVSLFLHQGKERGVKGQTCAWTGGDVSERQPVPDDGVQASHLRRALQHTERLRQRLRLLSRGQERSDGGKSKRLVC